MTRTLSCEWACALMMTSEPTMLRRQLKIYLCTHRKKWGLSQRELGLLLGMSKQAVSRFELEQQPVSAQLIIACELVFGVPFTGIFPGFCACVEDEVGARALALHDKLEGRTDAQSRKKLKLLSSIHERVKFAADA